MMYSQVDGLGMGSPLGVTLANIFMRYLKHQVTPNMLNQVTYLRNMDDFLIISKSRKYNDALFNKLNGLLKEISFIKEEESNNSLPFLDILFIRENDRFLTSNNSLPFLDILIIRKSDRFLTTVYRKAPFVGQYLHFQSFCSKKN